MTRLTLGKKISGAVMLGTTSRDEKTRIMKRALCTAGILSVITFQTSCMQIETVEAWDRGYLAEDTMQWEPDARSARLKGHVYTSKEASTGGAGAAGGGCGCN